MRKFLSTCFATGLRRATARRPEAAGRVTRRLARWPRGQREQHVDVRSMGLHPSLFRRQLVALEARAEPRPQPDCGTRTHGSRCATCARRRSLARDTTTERGTASPSPAAVVRVRQHDRPHRRPHHTARSRRATAWRAACPAADATRGAEWTRLCAKAQDAIVQLDPAKRGGPRMYRIGAHYAARCRRR